MPFELQWDAARYNQWYWWSYVTMLVVPVIVALMIRVLIRGRILRRIAIVIIALLCAWLTFSFSVQAISTKWQIRWEAAVTDEQKQIVADRDTGNLAFSPIIGAFCGGVSVCVAMGIYAISKRQRGA